MVRNGEIALADVKRILRRYWWIPTFMSLALAVLGLTASLVLPKKYTSSTVVLVEQPAVSKDLVRPVINDDLNHRISSMKATILSRTRLEMIIKKFDLFPQQRGAAPMDALVDKLKSAISVELIEPLPGSANREPPGFNVSVTFDNPQMAQQICQEVTSMFMEQNYKTRGDAFNTAVGFLSQQVQDAKGKLDEQDKRLADFKSKHLQILPDYDQRNLGLLTGMNSQLDAATQALTRAQQDKSLNETLLNQQEANWKAVQTSGGTSPESQEQELASLQDQLAVLTTKYTPEHPDVMKVKAQIENLKKRMADAPQTAPSAAQIALREPPSIQQLRTKIRQDEMMIAELTKRQSQIQEQTRTIEGRLQASPAVEQELKELTRDYQTALEIYNDLLKKLELTKQGKDLEQAQEGETFRVLDAPSLPSSPSFPKKAVFIGGSFGAGLALSLAILYLLALLDKALYTERDVEACLKLPVLTAVPSFDVWAHQGSSKTKFAGKYQGAPVSNA